MLDRPGGVWVYDQESFHDFLGFVAQCAPDFPEEDFLESDEQLDLVTAFSELRVGLSIVRKDLSEDALLEAEQKLEASLTQFKNGNEIAGSRILQELDCLIFSERLPPPGEDPR